MTAPSCPIHATPMNASQKGNGFFCPKKMPDGSYCKERVAAPPQGNAAAAVVAAPAVSTDATLACGAFDLAGRVYSGQIHSEDLTAQNAVIAFAVRAYTAMKTVMP